MTARRSARPCSRRSSVITPGARRERGTARLVLRWWRHAVRVPSDAYVQELTQELAQQLVGVGGVEAVTLGGSRACGDHTSASDVDMGLYYRPPLDVAALGALARQVAGAQAQVTPVGRWGSWVGGGDADVVEAADRWHRGLLRGCSPGGGVARRPPVTVAGGTAGRSWTHRPTSAKRPSSTEDGDGPVLADSLVLTWSTGS